MIFEMKAFDFAVCGWLLTAVAAFVVLNVYERLFFICFEVL